MNYYRDEVVNAMMPWKGCVKGDKTHHLIIDTYNNEKPLARGYKVTYDDKWCATTVSAAYIKAGYKDIFPLECGCGEMINKAIKMNIWIEADGYVPLPADAIMYDWDDSGVGDCKGNPEHVGLVIGCNGKTITVLEGNYKGGCNVRTLEVNGRYIRGFVVPKFTADKKPVTPTPAPVKTETVKILEAKSFDKSIAGTYIYTGEGRKIRRGAGTGYKALATLPKNTKMYNYGYYTITDGRKWLLVVVKINGTQYTGFVSCGKKGKYVKKL